MRARLVLCVCLAFAAPACSRSDERTFTLQGQVLSLEPARKQLTVKHEEIKGFMPAMTMPYEVRDAKLLDGLAPGDLINATLVVVSNGAYLSAIRKVGQAPLEKPPAEAPNPPASAGFELLKPGEAVPDSAFVDQSGQKRRFSAFKGSPVVMTFIYTKCPLPTFCPLMDRHFAALQTSLKADASLQAVRLVTVSFDPITDTPAVLREHLIRRPVVARVHLHDPAVAVDEGRPQVVRDVARVVHRSRDRHAKARREPIDLVA